jgi:hypothetical protein
VEVTTMGVDPREPESDLPEHEQDDTRRRTADPVAAPDPVDDAGLPEHERDEERAEDTGGQPTNP